MLYERLQSSTVTQKLRFGDGIFVPAPDTGHEKIMGTMHGGGWRTLPMTRDKQPRAPIFEPQLLYHSTHGLNASTCDEAVAGLGLIRHYSMTLSNMVSMRDKASLLQQLKAGPLDRVWKRPARRQVPRLRAAVRARRSQRICQPHSHPILICSC